METKDEIEKEFDMEEVTVFMHPIGTYTERLRDTLDKRKLEGWFLEAFVPGNKTHVLKFKRPREEG